MDEPYLDAHQSRREEPTAYENLLGDVLERAFAAGVGDPVGLVAALNKAGLPAPDGSAWTVERFEREMRRLGA